MRISTHCEHLTFKRNINQIDKALARGARAKKGVMPVEDLLPRMRFSNEGDEVWLRPLHGTGGVKLGNTKDVVAAVRKYLNQVSAHDGHSRLSA